MIIIISYVISIKINLLTYYPVVNAGSDKRSELGLFIFLTYSLFKGQPFGATNRLSQPSDRKGTVGLAKGKLLCE